MKEEIENGLQIGGGMSDFNLRTTIYILVQKLGGDVVIDFNKDFKKALAETKTLRVLPDETNDSVRLKIVEGE